MYGIMSIMIQNETSVLSGHPIYCCSPYLDGHNERHNDIPGIS